MNPVTSDDETIRVAGGDSAGSAQPRGWPAVRRQPVPAGNSATRWDNVPPPELHPYYSESWFTAEGARLKARRLQQAGLPNFRDWRFLTVTVANRNISPRDAYDLGKQRMRRFLTRIRRALGRTFRWCWKLEFHEDGYAHWHLLIEYLERVPQEMLAELESWWGLGRINVRRVNGRDVHYVFKYVAKGPEDVPQWVALHKGRFRVFQASRGFYTKRRARVAKRGEPLTCIVRVDLLTRIAWDERKALLVETDRHGNRRMRPVKLRMTFNALLAARAYESIRKRVQLAPPGVVNISQLQAEELKHEHRKFRGLGRIPANAAAA